MALISVDFAIFACVVILIFHISPVSFKKPWLLLASLFFYFLIDVRFFCVLAILGMTNYWLAIRSLASQKKALYSNAAFFIDISSFGLVKILSSHYLEQVSISSGSNGICWILPVGFSFYLLQLISFQLDFRAGRIKVIPSFMDFALFICYFPKVLSGPIEKPVNFLKQITSPRKMTSLDIYHGFGLIFIGLIRKLFIANILSVFMPDWISEAHSINWLQMIGYVILIYNDFAGYTAIVRGISHLLGIVLSPNFQQPLLSRNFSEFWTRWHMSLSTWLRETIFFPLSRKLGRNSGNFTEKMISIIIPPMLTMLASGFWHGASLAMMVWGGLQGIYLVLERLLYERHPGLRPASLSNFGKMLSTTLVFILFIFSMVPFAAGATKHSFIIWKGLLSPEGFSLPQKAIPLVCLVIFSFFLDFLSNRIGKEAWWEDLPMIPRSAVIALGLIILFTAIWINTAAPGEVFIYQGF
jgi:D-alanyl-lipoteichoic acid acyltransferase DltB (MBOAT superfamily)